ncbi:putative vacuolar sorting-associated protein 13B [Nymphaea thermarum]|nr:putative vacuolar sorting-associated protein 13B [Nymphaea thermarum]
MSEISSEANTSSFVSSGEMKSSPFSSIITKMNEGNYEMWAMQVKRTLIAHDNEHLILEPEPVQKVGKYTTWFKDNSLVMVWIVGTLSQEIANEVLHKENANDMWNSLAATYSQARNETRIMQLHHDIHQMRQDGRPLHTYYSSLKSMFERLNSYFPACKCEQQKAHRDMLMVGVFLSGLDSVYESAKNQMLTSPSIPPIDETYSRLSRIPISASTVPDTTSAILATRGRGGPFFARGRGGHGHGNTPSRPPKPQHTASSSELCVDDIISQLRNLIGAPDPTISTVTIAASASSFGMYSAYTVCPATDTTYWLIDSGASTHLCRDKAQFTSYVPTPPGRSLIRVLGLSTNVALNLLSLPTVLLCLHPARPSLIDVSEIRLKLALEPAPTQRPPGILGMWSPILSAVGNAFKIQIHLRKVMHRNRILRKSAVVNAILNRIWRDLIHNPLHLIFAVDVLGMTSSTLATLSKGFAELSTDGQFLQRRSKQVSSRRITGVGDGILRGTEALAQGVAFGVSGVVTKPVENARQHGVLGFAQGVGQAFLGVVAQPVSGVLDFFSLTVDGIGASYTKFLGMFGNNITLHRVRNPRVIHAHDALKEYSEREAVGQMVLYLAEASRHFGCTEIFKEPSKFAWTDFYEEHFMLPHRRTFLITNRRVIMLQCSAPDKLDRKPCKILWDVPWEELLALELAKVGFAKPTHLILHLRNFRRSQNFVRVVKCNVNDEEVASDSEATRICFTVRKTWKAYLSRMRSLRLKVGDDAEVCSIWSPICPDGYVSVGDIVRLGSYPPNVAAVYQNVSGKFALPLGYDLVWRNCFDDYVTKVSIWYPRPPEGFVSIGCVAVADYTEPRHDAAYCVHESLVSDAEFEEQTVWKAPNSYPWACYLYQVNSDALQFVALRQKWQDLNWKPVRVESSRLREAMQD